MATSDNLRLRSWLSLALLDDIPLAVKLDWLREFGTPDDVISQPLENLRKSYRLDRPLSEKLGSATADEVIEWIGKYGGSCFWLGEEGYPGVLLEKLSYAPLVVYTRGYPQLLDKPSVALIGSATPTKRAIERTRTIAFELAQDNITVVAGVSPGIAQAAHLGVQSAGKGAIGIIGNARSWTKVQLAEEICVNGLLISEHAPGSNTRPDNYALRHRLLAGLASVCVVVEAASDCETLTLARDALNLGCEVAAIPADPENKSARGSNMLLREGAALVENAKDIVVLVNAMNFA